MTSSRERINFQELAQSIEAQEIFERFSIKTKEDLNKAPQEFFQALRRLLVSQRRLRTNTH